jgi:hypothetical protein
VEQPAKYNNNNIPHTKIASCVLWFMSPALLACLCGTVTADPSVLCLGCNECQCISEKLKLALSDQCQYNINYFLQKLASLFALFIAITVTL